LEKRLMDASRNIALRKPPGIKGRTLSSREECRQAWPGKGPAKAISVPKANRRKQVLLGDAITALASDGPNERSARTVWEARAGG